MWEPVEQYGLHVADDSVSLRNSYVYLSTLDSLGDFAVTSSTYTVGNETDPGIEYYSYDEGFQAGNEAGVYLVRSSVVPVPPALYLFGSGLIALWRLRKRG